MSNQVFAALVLTGGTIIGLAVVWMGRRFKFGLDEEGWHRAGELIMKAANDPRCQLYNALKDRDDIVKSVMLAASIFLREHPHLDLRHGSVPNGEVERAQRYLDLALKYYAERFREACEAQQKHRTSSEALRKHAANTLSTKDIQEMYDRAAALDETVSGAKHAFWGLYKEGGYQGIGLAVWPDHQAYLLLK